MSLLGSKRKRSISKDTSGNALMMMAAAVLPLTAMIGGGLDMGIAYTARAKLQNACDAGVLAGRQAMQGNIWSTDAQAEAQKFFDFNYPAGLHGATNLAFAVRQNPGDGAELLATASAEIPTVIMRVFQIDSLDIAVDCNAKKETGHNDIMVVLDVTGSMLNAPSVDSTGTSKIGRLRVGTLGLYRGLDDGDDETITRFAILPYSHTVNVGGLLESDWVLDNQVYENRLVFVNGVFQPGRTGCGGLGPNCEVRRSDLVVPATKSGFATNRSFARNLPDLLASVNGYTGSVMRSVLPSSGSTANALSRFQNGGFACIEERPSVGSSGETYDSISNDDIDTVPTNGGEPELQFGRYDPSWINSPYSVLDCPNSATMMQEYASLGAFQSQIATSTARVGGSTFHDIGMLWAVRLMSRTGMFADQNPETIDGAPVTQHIVYMTDGILFPNPDVYSAYGTANVKRRVEGSGSHYDRHLSRFEDACNLARARGITVWVIALDVTATDDILPCASSDTHFLTSDGTDLEEVFETIGRRIGKLRLTK